MMGTRNQYKLKVKQRIVHQGMYPLRRAFLNGNGVLKIAPTAQSLRMVHIKLRIRIRNHAIVLPVINTMKEAV